MSNEKESDVKTDDQQEAFSFCSCFLNVTGPKKNKTNGKWYARIKTFLFKIKGTTKVKDATKQETNETLNG